METNGPLSSNFFYLDNIATADVAFKAWGRSRDEMFASAAAATLGVMVENPQGVLPRQQKSVSLQDEQIDLLLVRFLQEFVFYKDAEQMFLWCQDIKIDLSGSGFQLAAQLVGEKIDPSRHKLGVDVKAVTMHRLLVEEKDGQWQATVVLDI